VEDIAINVLKNVMDRRAARLASNKICVVDVAVAVWREVYELSLKLKVACNGGNVVRVAHGQSFSG
jgi:hypothetical protein